MLSTLWEATKGTGTWVVLIKDAPYHESLTRPASGALDRTTNG